MSALMSEHLKELKLLELDYFHFYGSTARIQRGQQTVYLVEAA